ncbi:hypothetical protein DFJ73DRAFT_946308 [Zopfochytrium polystomum]|nr:hypothetical protein DFJ73DRAFT_946308 [Zopfochytrium polystomum]
MLDALRALDARRTKLETFSFTALPIAIRCADGAVVVAVPRGRTLPTRRVLRFRVAGARTRSLSSSSSAVARFVVGRLPTGAAAAGPGRALGEVAIDGLGRRRRRGTEAALVVVQVVVEVDEDGHLRASIAEEEEEEEQGVDGEEKRECRDDDDLDLGGRGKRGGVAAAAAASAVVTADLGHYLCGMGMAELDAAVTAVQSMDRAVLAEWKRRRAAWGDQGTEEGTDELPNPFGFSVVERVVGELPAREIMLIEYSVR